MPSTGDMESGFVDVPGDLARSPVITKPRSVVVEIAAERRMAEKLARELRLDILKAQLE